MMYSSHSHRTFSLRWIQVSDQVIGNTLHMKCGDGGVGTVAGGYLTLTSQGEKAFKWK